ncbi:MAG: winged helix-turn-helix transcriptional regulator [Oscillospiraceae bacterium]
MEKLLHTTEKSKSKKVLMLLNYLQKNGPQSRIDLSKKLNLTKAVITSLTNEMITSGVVLEKGELVEATGTHSRGRRKTLLDINENYKLVFGVVIEKETVFVGLTNLKGQVLDKRKKNFHDISYRELLELIVLNISTIMKNNCITNENILGLGVCVSRGGGDLIEGAKKMDKITRLKKDLTHALPIKIATNATIAGGLVAQRIFTQERSKSVLLLRLGEVAESGVMIDGVVYRGFTGNAGGFWGILDEVIKDSKNSQEYFEQVTTSILTCHTVLDTEKIFCFGAQFENSGFMNCIQELLIKRGCKNVQLERPLLTDDTVFLSPCAQAIESFFYMN